MFQECEVERGRVTKKCLKLFCELEKNSLNQKQKLLSELEAAVNDMNNENDLDNFINKEKLPEVTHKFSKVLRILDT